MNNEQCGRSAAPAVSVVIPCFNQAQFLGDALACLVAQTCPDWEAIVVNDGSTDDTVEVARSWTERDRRIVHLDQRNHGLAAARNRGLAAARGRYVQFLDADDVILPDKLEVQLALLGAAAEPAFCYCDYRFGCAGDVRQPAAGSKLRVRLDPQQPVRDVALKWETEVSIPIHCYLFDARFFTECGVRFNERLLNHEDWSFLLSILRVQPVALFVDRELAVYRMHSGSMARHLPRMRDGFLKAIASEKSLFTGDAEMLRLLAEKKRVTEAVYRHQAPWCRLKAKLRGVLVQSRLSKAIEEVTRVIPVGETFALVDQDEWATGDDIAGRRRIPWYSPKDDKAALQDFETLRNAGTAFIVIAWPSFWWLDYYPGLLRELRGRFPCTMQNDRLVIYDLRVEAGGSARIADLGGQGTARS